jgi:hypothetical protein
VTHSFLVRHRSSKFFCGAFRNAQPNSNICGACDMRHRSRKRYATEEEFPNSEGVVGP